MAIRGGGLFRFLVVCAAFSLGTLAANTIIVTSLSDGSGSGHGDNTGVDYLAQQFTLTGSASVGSIEAELKTTSGTLPLSDLTAYIYSNTSNDIGATLEGTSSATSLGADVDLPTSPFNLVTFTFSSDVNLAAGTYWVEIVDSSSNQFQWEYQNTGYGSDNTGTDGTVNGRYYHGGYYTTGVGVGTPPLMVELDGADSTTPEPGYSALVIGLCGLMAAFRLRHPQPRQ